MPSFLFRVRHVSADAGSGERSQECLAAWGGTHRLGVGGAVEQRASDVAFEAAELADKSGLVGAEMIGGGVDGTEGHRDLEGVEPVPAGEPT